MSSRKQFSGLPGVYVPVADTVRSFREILDGKYDDLPEAAFMSVGTVEDVVAKAEKLK
jgi:F-type H+-transporting ATPase subunit beta